MKKTGILCFWAKLGLMCKNNSKSVINYASQKAIDAHFYCDLITTFPLMLTYNVTSYFILTNQHHLPL